MRFRSLLLTAVLLLGSSLFAPGLAQADDVYYANCAEARAAGAAPIFRGQPGYRAGLDRDNDGVACETGSGDEPPAPPTPGTPPPPGAQTDFVKYSWAPDIYSVTFASSGWIWRQLTAASWASYGYPTPRLAGWIEGTTLYRYETASTLYATLNGTVHALSYAEWSDMSFRSPNVVRGGYVNLWWKPQGIGFTNEQTTTTATFDQWAQASYPTPQSRGILPGDYVCSMAGSSTLYYRGATLYDYAMTYDEWYATGFSSPRAC